MPRSRRCQRYRLVSGAQRTIGLARSGLDIWWHTRRVSDTHSVAVGPKGRVVIPATIRSELGIQEGSVLVALVEGQAIVLVPRSAIKSRLRSIFADVGPSMRQELIADRRGQALRESSG